MIFISNPLVLPVLVVIWSIDTWIWMASIRLLLGKLNPDNQFTSLLGKLADPLPKIVNRQLAVWFRKAVPQWLAWTVTIVSLLMLRHILLLSVISFSRG